jgi:UDPglucose 6-dehydrogenase
VIGLGKLGLCTAACFASKGHNVIGYDKDNRVRELLRRRESPIDESGIEGLLSKAWNNFEVTDDLGYLVNNSQITLIIVPTPSDAGGRFTNSFIESVINGGFADALKKKADFHVVDIVSTVMPGSCDTVFKPLLESLTGKECGRDFGLVYNPEFIALGSVIRDFLNPDMVLIGASDVESARITRQLYETSCDSKPVFSEMSLLSAEVCKLSLNCFVTMKISFANELSAICENIPGVDIDAVTSAIGADSRIGKKYLTAGLGFGGTCFPRDNIAFIAFAKGAGYDPKLAPAVVAINHSVVTRLLGFVVSCAGAGAKAAILGLSYKPGTHIVEESQSLALAKALVKNGYVVSVNDPKALQAARTVLGESVSYESDPYRCVKDAAVVVVMTAWPEYKELDWVSIDESVAQGCAVIDCWRQLDSSLFSRSEYIGFGRELLPEQKKRVEAVV